MSQGFQPRLRWPGAGADAHLGGMAGVFCTRRAGTCLVLRDTDVAGIYWLVTACAHPAGVGRALMTAVLRLAPELPTALCATAASEPLYDSLGFGRVTVPPLVDPVGRDPVAVAPMRQAASAGGSFAFPHLESGRNGYRRAATEPVRTLGRLRRGSGSRYPGG